MKKLILLASIALFVFACKKPSTTDMITTPTDSHSYAQPNEARVTHLDLDIQVNFDSKTIEGVASWTIEKMGKADKIILDVKDLTIQKILINDSVEAVYSVGDEKTWLGCPLTISLTPDAKSIHIYYNTSPNAAALQWLSPQQTADKKHPFLFTQSQAILARTWIPCQDSPGIRYTYNAKVKVPIDLMALMSADNPINKTADGIYTFKQEKPIPSYLMALAVGDVVFSPIGPKTGVYAEPSMIEKSAYEFADMQKMLEAAEAIYGEYRWGRYDVIVLPPSFPFGGMENPVLTFATPTIIAGDRSLVSLVAHELAHSWSGNLVTNATWDDFWLNEGFTVYFERRIMEAIEGKPYADMLALLGYQDVTSTVESIGATHPDTHLKLNLKDRDPDEGLTDIAYEKGFAFLRTIENAVGRERFDAFINRYFDEFAFKTIHTEQFVKYINKELIGSDKDLAAKINLEAWIYGPGIPENVVAFTSERFAEVDKTVSNWQSGTKPSDLKTNNWSTHEWMHFIRQLPQDLGINKVRELDNTFGFTSSTNAEIACAWFVLSVKNEYRTAYPAIEKFLISVGRRKFLTPIYRELIKTDYGKQFANATYKKARPNYHYVATQTMDDLLK